MMCTALKRTSKILGLMLALCLSLGVQAEVNNSLADKQRIVKVVHEQVDEEMAKHLLAAPYKAYYQIGGKLKGKTYKFSSVKKSESYPDDGMVKLAKQLINKLKIQGSSNTIGSRRTGSATAYVAFYPDGIENIEGVPGKGLAFVMVTKKNVMRHDMPTIKGIDVSDVYLLDITFKNAKG